jgi:hypothetical protein
MTFFSVWSARRWRIVDPLRDGKECPRCKAAVFGRDARHAHELDHIERTEFDQMILTAVRKACLAAGLSVEELAPIGEGSADEGLDDRLTRKARVVAGSDYDDEEDDDDG